MKIMVQLNKLPGCRVAGFTKYIQIPGERKDMTNVTFISKELVDKGWSGDKKYCVTSEDGTKYLFRVTPEPGGEKCREMFLLQKRVWELGISVCRPIDCGTCDEGVYTLQSWIDGEDAEQAIPYLADSQQYALGLDAGRILKKIHTIPAPENQRDWESRFNAKMDSKIKMYLECPIKYEGGEAFIEYMNNNRRLLKNRPQSFQHGDYHIGNMMVERSGNRLVVIDFDRFDFGDPWEEFNRIVWSAQASPLFASGMVNGYFDGEVPMEFWQLLALYIASNTLSSLPWAIPFGDEEIQTMLQQGREVLEWYDNMQNVIPSWYFKGYYLQYIDGNPYKLKAPYDFSFINRQYGKVFKVFDDQDSGNICFGTEKDGERYFIKFAGAPTESYSGTCEEAIRRLKSTLPVYGKLKHNNLIEFVKAEETGGGLAMVFRWADGDCMGRMYPAAHRRFMSLSAKEKVKVFRDILDFLNYIASSGYVAVDFYDGSIMYDFEKQRTTICDIDFFRKQPCVNDMGRMWGSSRFQSPEEYQLGAAIDEVTNVYTAGAFAFALFGNYSRDIEEWTLSKELFHVASKATAADRSIRQQSIRQLMEEWDKGLNGKM